MITFNLKDQKTKFKYFYPTIQTTKFYIWSVHLKTESDEVLTLVQI